MTEARKRKWDGDALAMAEFLGLNHIDIVDDDNTMHVDIGLKCIEAKIGQVVVDYGGYDVEVRDD